MTAAPFPDSARLDPLVVVPYDSSWPVRFQEAKAVVTPVLRPWLVREVAGLAAQHGASPEDLRLTHEIEHIGSTAVPGLPAKPIIDMLAVVRDVDAARAAIPALAALGWPLAPQIDDDEIRQLSFCTPTPEHRTHHLHVVEFASRGWRTWLAFRDHLRAHPDDAALYASLKAELATRFANDRAAYRAAKRPFIEAVVGRAM